MQLIPRLVYWADMGVYNVTGDCADLTGLPDILFNLSGDVYSVPASQWVTEVRRHLANLVGCRRGRFAQARAVSLRPSVVAAPAAAAGRAAGSSRARPCARLEGCLQISDNIDPSPDACISSIQPGGADNAVILGTTFMRQVYSSFTVADDMQSATIGLAQSASSTAGVTTNATNAFLSQAPSS